MKKELATLSVLAKNPREESYQALNTPIYHSSAFAFRNLAELREYAQGKLSRPMYSRYGNPTTDTAEDVLAKLEDCEAAHVTSSGMAATFLTLLATLKQGDQLLTIDALYGGTHKLFQEFLPRWGISLKMLSIDQLSELEQHCQHNTRLLWLETPTNPTNYLVDLATVSAKAKSLGMLVALDNTFATPINQRARALGVDIIVHSGTKYLGGHDDLLAGFIAGSYDLINKTKSLNRLLGAILDPHTAALLIRGMKTLDVRMERINRNSKTLAQWLEQSPKVKTVYYPFLESHPQYQLARRQMSGGSGIVTVDLKSTVDEELAVERFVDALKVIPLAPTLGGVETKISYPLYTSHVGLTAEELARAGVSKGTLRFAVGIEAVDDLIADIEQALQQIPQ